MMNWILGLFVSLTAQAADYESVLCFNNNQEQSFLSLAYTDIGNGTFAGELLVRNNDYSKEIRKLPVATLNADYKTLLIFRSKAGQLIFKKNAEGEAVSASLYFNDPDYYSSNWVCKAYRSIVQE